MINSYTDKLYFSMTRRTPAQWRAYDALKAAELHKLEVEAAYRNRPQWRLPLRPNLPVDAFMALSNNGWRID